MANGEKKLFSGKWLMGEIIYFLEIDDYGNSYKKPKKEIAGSIQSMEYTKRLRRVLSILSIIL